MIFFADESYEELPNGRYRVVVGGIAIDEYRYRALETAVRVARLDFAREVYRPDNLSEEEIRLKADRLELKGTKTLKRKNLEAARAGGRVPGLAAALTALEAAENCRARTIWRMKEVSDTGDFFGRNEALTQPYIEILQELGTLAVNRDRPVILAFDTVNGRVNNNLTRRVSNYLYRHPDAEELGHFVPVPFWIPSETTAGTQVADLVVHTLLKVNREEFEFGPELGAHHETILRMLGPRRKSYGQL